jgi:chemotaxis protein MotB
MASTDNEIPTPIIVKKIKKGGGGHHGGAWKVAYADFVTAMMAFFLLMWLLNVTTEEEKNAISNYFDPTHPKVSASESGSGGILGGLTMSPDGAMSSMQSPVVNSPTETPEAGNALGEQRARKSNSDSEGTNKLDFSGKTDEELELESKNNGLNILDEVQQAKQAELEELRQAIEKQQNETFEGIKQKIYEEIEKSPELADLKDHLMVDITPEGLRIQIVDKEGRSMFPSGQANMFGFMEQLLAKVSQFIKSQPNQLSVRGHTDGVQYPAGADYDNWNLSADRALASRSVMVDQGISKGRIENVVGRADREHLFPEEPLSARNRRISIVLLREKLESEEAIRKAADDAGIGKTEQPVSTIEDRTNDPSLDRTVVEPETDIVNEMKKFEEQRAARDAARRELRTRPLPQPVPETQTDSDGQFLQF